MTLSAWQPYREPVRATLTRSVAISIAVGAAAALSFRDSSRFPLFALVTLWPALGGHFVELWFLNWLRPRLSSARVVQVTARLLVWFIAGLFLALAMYVTISAIRGARPVRWPAWWVTGLAFIGVEMVAHVALRLRGRPSVFGGKG